MSNEHPTSQREITGDGNAIGDNSQVTVTLTTTQQHQLQTLVAELKRELQAALDRIEHHPKAMAAVSEIETHAKQPSVNVYAIGRKLKELAELAACADGVLGVIDRLLPMIEGLAN